MKVINLTPHNVDVCDENGNVIKTYIASGMVARVAHSWEIIDYVDGIPVTVRENEKVINLPTPEEDTVYIVSNIILNYCKDRLDIIAPVQQVKINGRVVGCRSFMRNRRES